MLRILDKEKCILNPNHLRTEKFIKELCYGFEVLYSGGGLFIGILLSSADASYAVPHTKLV